MDHFTYQHGELCAENVPIRRIAEAVGTPFYAYSTATLHRHVQVLREALSPLSPMLCFAVKACPNIAVLRTLAAAGMGADVVSGGELFRARKAGINPENIVFSGVGKTREEIDYALEEGIRQFNVESASELALLNECALKKNVKAPTALRINPDVDAKTHAKISTGKKENKFGISMRSARLLYAETAKMEGISVQGISMHIGSQLTSLAPFEEAYSRVREFVVELRAAGHTIRTLDIGGGLGVPYRDGDVPPLPADYGRMIAGIFSGLDIELICEPGRLIAGNAGILITRVVHLKENEGRHYAVVDAGMNDLMRPALYDSHHDIIPVMAATTALSAFDVVGPVCESSDVFMKDTMLPVLHAGDLLALRTAGAYGASMSGSYNSRPLTPEVLVNSDQFAVIRARQGYEEMLRGETFAPWQSP